MRMADVDGVRVANTALAAGGAVDSAVNTVLGRISPASAGEHFSGLIDEAQIFNRALSSNEIAAIHAAGALGLCRPTQPPVIFAQPQSRTNAPGTTTTFSATAGGSSPLHYRWLFNGSPLSNGGRISGATSNTLTITGVLAGDAGGYS
jgi:Immunoglobulin domain/Concanavalin A-like lectin/glucanases superfamily